MQHMAALRLARLVIEHRVFVEGKPSGLTHEGWAAIIERCWGCHAYLDDNRHVKQGLCEECQKRREWERN